MRKIESEIWALARNMPRDEVRLSKRDVLYWDGTRAGIVYRLWYTDIAVYQNGRWIQLIPHNAQWISSKTTQARLRALGLVAPPNPHYLRQRKHYWATFEGSYNLFLYCWRKLKEYAHGTEIDNRNATEWLDTIAAETVNNPNSPFYIHG